MAETLPLAVVPVFGNASRLHEVLQSLQEIGLPTLVVNDGNGESLTRSLEHAGYAVLDMGTNSGVGAATRAGLEFADAHGYQGVLAVDADGAHEQVAVACVASRAVADPRRTVLTTRFGHVGERFIPQEKIDANLFARLAFTTATGLTVADVTCGLRYYPAPLSRIRWHENRFAFIYESLAHVLDGGPQLAPVPVFVAYDPVEPYLTKANELEDFLRFCDSRSPGRLNPWHRLRAHRALLTKQPVEVALADTTFRFDPVPAANSWLITASRATAPSVPPPARRCGLGFVVALPVASASLPDELARACGETLERLGPLSRSLPDPTCPVAVGWTLRTPAPELPSVAIMAVTEMAESMRIVGWRPVLYGGPLRPSGEILGALRRVNRASACSLAGRLLVIDAGNVADWEDHVLSPSGRPWELGFSPDLLDACRALRLRRVRLTTGCRSLGGFLPIQSSEASIEFGADDRHQFDLDP